MVSSLRQSSASLLRSSVARCVIASLSLFIGLAKNRISSLIVVRNIRLVDVATIHRGTREHGGRQERERAPYRGRARAAWVASDARVEAQTRCRGRADRPVTKPGGRAPLRAYL